MGVWCGSNCCEVCCVEGGFEGRDGIGEDASSGVPAVSGEILDCFLEGLVVVVVALHKWQ